MPDTVQIKKKALELGAHLAGVADLQRVAGIPTVPAGLLSPYTRAVVMAVAVSPAVFERLEDQPTSLYAHHYQVVNALLDHIALLLQGEMLRRGFRALAIPASQRADDVRLMGHVSHKALGKAAGLGWQGKSLLLVTPAYGPRVRLASVLTNAPLEADPLLPNRCGSCRKCQEACPVQAIRGATWEDHPPSRDDALELAKCAGQLGDFARLPGIGKSICGICIKACPWGKSR